MGDRPNRHRDGGGGGWNRNSSGSGGGGHHQGRRNGGYHDRGGGGNRQQNDRHDGHSRHHQQQQNYENRRNGHGGGGRGGGGYGNQFDRRRRHQFDDEGPSAKKQHREEEKPPTAIEFEVEGIIGEKRMRFFYEEKKPFLENVSAVHCVRIHGQIENSLPLNISDISLFLGRCALYLKAGASLISDEHKKLEAVIMHKTEVRDKMKTICMGLLGNCDFIEFDENRLNLLKLSLFADRIHELKVTIEGKSGQEASSGGMDALLDWLHGRNSTKKKLPPKKLDFEAKGAAVARWVVHRIKFDKTVAHFVVRFTAPIGALFEFLIAREDQNIRIELKKEKKDDAENAFFILHKSPLESYSSAEMLQLRKREEYPRELPKIAIPNLAREKQPSTSSAN